MDPEQPREQVPSTPRPWWRARSARLTPSARLARWIGAEPAEWHEPTGRRRDVRTALICLSGGLVLLLAGVNSFGDAPRWVRLFPLMLMCSALLLRRVAPVPAVAVGVAAGLWDLSIGLSLGTALIFAQVAYDAALYGRREVMPWLLRLSVAVTVVTVLALLLLVDDVDHPSVVAVAVSLTLVFIVPVATAAPVRQFRERASRERERAELERQRAEQIARLAELDRRQALADERARMARELHDVVANHLSAVAIHATAAQSIAHLDAEKLADILAVIRENSVRGLAEMRRMVEVLREPGPAGAASVPDAVAGAVAGAVTGGVAGAVTGAVTGVAGSDAAFADIGRLVDAAPGIRVTLERIGDSRPLPADVDHAAYRIVQESLTNAAKHTPGGSATVRVEYRPASVVITVDSVTAGPAAVPERVAGAGMGLRGMRERVALLGGVFSAGPAADGSTGWRVHAELPTALPAEPPVRSAAGAR